VVVDGDIHLHRLVAQDQERARRTFTLTAEVFGEEHARLSDAYLDRYWLDPSAHPPLRRARQLAPG
jgi:hypothetical protein